MKQNTLIFRLATLGAIGIGLVVFITLSIGLQKDEEKESVATQSSQKVQEPQVVQPVSEKPMATRTSENTVAKRPAPNHNTMQELMAWAESSDINDRMKAVLALRDMDTVESVELLTKLLKDPEGVVVSEAIDALNSIALTSDLAAEVFDVLQEKAMDQYFPYRSQAIVAAATIGFDKEMMQMIKTIMPAADQESLSAVTRAMSFIAIDDCVPHLKAVLKKSNDAVVNQSAANTLIKINTPESIAAIVALLSSSVEEEQKLGAWALSRRENEVFAAQLRNSITSGALNDSTIGLVAQSPQAGEVLGTVFVNPSVDKQKAKKLLDIVAEHTKYGSAKTRNNMAQAVSALLGSSDPEIAAAAAETIGQIGASEDQTEALEAALSSDSVLVQEKTLYAYAQYCAPTNYKPLTELYWDEDEKIRRTAFFLSSAFLNASDRPVLEKASTHEDLFIAKQSKVLLKNIPAE